MDLSGMYWYLNAHPERARDNDARLTSVGRECTSPIERAQVELRASTPEKRALLVHRPRYRPMLPTSKPHVLPARHSLANGFFPGLPPQARQRVLTRRGRCGRHCAGILPSFCGDGRYRVLTAERLAGHLRQVVRLVYHSALLGVSHSL